MQNVSTNEPSTTHHDQLLLSRAATSCHVQRAVYFLNTVESFTLPNDEFCMIHPVLSVPPGNHYTTTTTKCWPRTINWYYFRSIWINVKSMFISLTRVLSELNHISINFNGGLLLQYLTSASKLMNILLICDVQKKTNNFWIH